MKLTGNERKLKGNVWVQKCTMQWKSDWITREEKARLGLVATPGCRESEKSTSWKLDMGYVWLRFGEVTNNIYETVFL